MAATSRALTLKLLADISDFTKGLDKGTKQTQTFGDKVTAFGKKAGLAFAAAAAAAAVYATKLAVDGVKAAIEDEAAQIRLATSLRNVTGATDNQIKSTEAYILQTSLAKGVTDDELRPSLDRLVRSTKDVAEAQKLQTLALDIAAGSGKSLEAVTQALGRGLDGTKTSLGRLGIGLTAAELKTMSMEEITAKLAVTFGGQAAEKADTFAGKMDRLKIAFDEGKETVGSFILDAITPMVDFVVQKVVPAIQAFTQGLGGAEGLKGTLNTIIGIAKSIFVPVIQGIQSAFNKVKDSVMENKDEFQALFHFIKTYLAPFLGGALKVAIQAIGTAISIVVNIVGDLIGGFRTVISLAGKVGSFFGGLNPFGGGRAAGGPVSMGKTYLVGERGPELFSPNGSGTIIPNKALGGTSSGNTINISVSGAIDPAATARQIANLLKSEASTSGSFINLGRSVFV